MEVNPAFTKVEPDLLPVLDELRRREQAPEASLDASPKLKRDRHGILIVKAAGQVINSEMAWEESEDDLG